MTDYHESSCAQTPCCGDYTPKFPNSASNNYKVPLGLRGIDDYLLDGPQLFKVHTRAYVEYAEGSFYPEKGGKTSFRRGGTEDCESPSEYFPYMYDLDACYLDQTKHYDLIGVGSAPARQAGKFARVCCPRACTCHTKDDCYLI